MRLHSDGLTGAGRKDTDPKPVDHEDEPDRRMATGADTDAAGQDRFDDETPANGDNRPGMTDRTDFDPVDRVDETDRSAMGHRVEETDRPDMGHHVDETPDPMTSTDTEPDIIDATVVDEEVYDNPAAPRSDVDTEALDLFQDNDLERFRNQWQEIQTKFVDDPRDAVQSADHLVAEVIKSLANAVNEHKTGLDGTWQDASTEAQTEDLRQALRKYRTFLNRLLEV